MPFHRSDKEDVASLTPGEPVELAFDLQPTSNVFDAGNRMRLTITCADRDNAEAKDISPAPVITVYRDAARPSRIELPVVGGERQKVEQKAQAGSLLTYGLFIVFFVVVLVIAFTYFLRRRMKQP